MKDVNQARDAVELRRLAEERLKCRPADPRGPPSEAEMQRLIHELQVHQIELEMQNEELRESRAEVEAGLARYTDLYDFAPTGYFTLARDGTIRAVNLTGARLVGIERAHLLSRRFTSLVANPDQPLINVLLEKTFSSSARECCDVAIQRKDATPLFVRIEAICTADPRECRAAMLDVTEQHHLEAQRNRLIQELREAAALVKQLQGILSICSYCKKIRGDQGSWEQLEAYISKHSEALFSHGICPACLEIARGDFEGSGGKAPSS